LQNTSLVERNILITSFERQTELFLLSLDSVCDDLTQ